jgi:heat shock protein 1/8
LYSVKNTLRDEKFKDKFKEDERSRVEKKVEEITKWFETNGDAESTAYEGKQKELEDVYNPIMTRLYSENPGAQGGMPGGMPGGFPGGFPGGAPGAQQGQQGPQVDEVD